MGRSTHSAYAFVRATLQVRQGVYVTWLPWLTRREALASIDSSQELDREAAMSELYPEIEPY